MDEVIDKALNALAKEEGWDDLQEKIDDKV